MTLAVSNSTSTNKLQNKEQVIATIIKLTCIECKEDILSDFDTTKHFISTGHNSFIKTINMRFVNKGQKLTRKVMVNKKPKKIPKKVTYYVCKDKDCDDLVFSNWNEAYRHRAMTYHQLEKKIKDNPLYKPNS